MGQFCPETKSANNLAVFDHFGIIKYKIFGASCCFAPSPGPPPETCLVLVGGGGLTAPPDPSWIKEWPTVNAPTGPTLFSYTYWQGPVIFAELWRPWGVLTFLVPKMILHRHCYTVNIARPLKSSHQMIQNRLWRHNLPRKLVSKLLCLRGLRTESKRKNYWDCFSRASSFPKSTSSFIFSSPLFSWERRIWEKSMLTSLGKLWCHRQLWITGQEGFGVWVLQK